jgi:aminomethyltransferase
MSLRTPLYTWHVAHGARLVDFAGWDMPVQYTSIVEEHQAVRTSAGMFDISHMGRLEFEGPDALALIQQILTNDAAGMKPGQIRYGLLCNERGSVLDDVLVYRLASFWLMVVNASNREKVLNWIGQHRRGLRVEVKDRTMDWVMVAIQGPRALEIVRTFWPGAADLKYYFGTLLGSEVGATKSEPILISRTGYTGEDGFEIIDAANKAASLVAHILADCALAQGISLLPCGLGARDTLRLEAAMPLYGHELSEEIDPFQAGLAWAVKMDKGDFVGRDALLFRRQDTTRPRRVGLELEGKRIAREGSTVLRDGRAIGRVTSGTFGPTVNKAIAMAYVEPAQASVGVACAVDVRGKPAPAQIVPLPFYDRKRKP